MLPANLTALVTSRGNNLFSRANQYLVDHPRKNVKINTQEADYCASVTEDDINAHFNVALMPCTTAKERKASERLERRTDHRLKNGNYVLIQDSDINKGGIEDVLQKAYNKLDPKGKFNLVFHDNSYALPSCDLPENHDFYYLSFYDLESLRYAIGEENLKKLQNDINDPQNEGKYTNQIISIRSLSGGITDPATGNIRGRTTKMEAIFLLPKDSKVGIRYYNDSSVVYGDRVNNIQLKECMRTKECLSFFQGRLKGLVNPALDPNSKEAACFMKVFNNKNVTQEEFNNVNLDLPILTGEYNGEEYTHTLRDFYNILFVTSPIMYFTPEALWNKIVSERVVNKSLGFDFQEVQGLEDRKVFVMGSDNKLKEFNLLDMTPTEEITETLTGEEITPTFSESGEFTDGDEKESDTLSTTPSISTSLSSVSISFSNTGPRSSRTGSISTTPTPSISAEYDSTSPTPSISVAVSNGLSGSDSRSGITTISPTISLTPSQSKSASQTGLATFNVTTSLTPTLTPSLSLSLSKSRLGSETRSSDKSDSITLTMSVSLTPEQKKSVATTGKVTLTSEQMRSLSDSISNSMTMTLSPTPTTDKVLDETAFGCLSTEQGKKIGDSLTADQAKRLESLLTSQQAVSFNNTPKEQKISAMFRMFADNAMDKTQFERALAILTPHQKKIGELSNLQMNKCKEAVQTLSRTLTLEKQQEIKDEVKKKNLAWLALLGVIPAVGIPVGLYYLGKRLCNQKRVGGTVYTGIEMQLDTPRIDPEEKRSWFQKLTSGSRETDNEITV